MEETKVKESVTKKVIVGTMQNYTGAIAGKRWNKEDTTIAYDAFLASLKALILTYGKVILPGIGTFEVKIRKGKRSPNNFGIGNDKWCYSQDKQFVYCQVSERLNDAAEDLPYTFINGSQTDAEEVLDDGGEE